MMRAIPTLMLAGALLAVPATSHAQTAPPRAEVGRSEVGPEDELGRLRWMTDASRSAVMARATGKVYDLATDYFIGMPSFADLGDPPYQFWMTHTPRGTVVDDPASVGRMQNETVSYTGDAVSFYTHMGTHIDALNHFGLHGKDKPACIEVCDEGDGVPEADREAIFEPFHRLKRGGNGSGLGLNLVQQIMRLHGGYAEVVGRDAAGACFRLVF